MSTIIAAKSLSKWFGEVIAVNNLDLEIGSGITGLLGPNGAGKSTFIKLALGLHAPSRGKINVLGGAPRNNLRVLRRIGYCPEIDHFYDNTTGYEFVYWLNRYWGMNAREADRAAMDAIEIVHMTGRMHDPIEEYSKGMRQRIKIAQALSPRPELLFLDEPMNGLDPQGRDEMYALIQRLGDIGLSVIVSSHILYEIERITDNVVLLFNGALIAQGRVRDIRDMIDRHPHTIRVESGDPRRAAAMFMAEDHVLSVKIEEGGVIMRTSDPNRCYARLNAAAMTEPALIAAIECSDDSLQSVFDYLTK
ncbi:MAG: ABC transporter ATP-binding protein [Candidatus Hydrogenedentes bacterium]|nr:ABC transporter ATP-binding protein [Candidatus Hydrogenedentota bacterium]